MRTRERLHADMRLEICADRVGFAFESGFASADLESVGRVGLLQSRTGEPQGHGCWFGSTPAAAVLKLHPEDPAATFGFQVTRRG
jgi:hypothetical protein